MKFAVAVLGVAAVLAAAAYLVWGDDEPSRQEAVGARGAQVMPFDLDATTHVFDAMETGGVQTVVADDPDDREQVALVRDHLREEVERFRAGDFGDPATIHGHDMPGLAVLTASADRMTVSYRWVAAGAAITYRSDDPVVVEALHEWFAAQLRDHGTHADTP